MKAISLTGRTTRTEEDCCRDFARCPCNYEVIVVNERTGDARCIGSCTTREAFFAAMRLLSGRAAQS